MRKNDLRLMPPILLALASTNVGAQSAIIELYDQIAGPALHTHSTQLLADGTIVFDEYNITVLKDREADGSLILCKLLPGGIRSALTQALSAASALPLVVDPGRPASIDGEFRSITIRSGERVYRSTLHDYNMAESAEARRFLEAWQSIQRVVSCHGPNKSLERSRDR